MTADKWTDQEILKLEKKISKEYAQAQKELDQKAKEYFREYADRWKREEVYHQAGILSEDAFGKWFKANRDSSVTDSELKDIYKSHTGRYTDESFKAWEISQLGRGAHWEDLRNQMAERLAQSAIIAQDYINNKLPAVYTKNSNEIAKIAQDSAMDQGITGIRFDLVDEYAVKRLAEGSREVRPYKPIIIDLPKTNRFNYTKLQNALIQGILQGDSIEHLADRFEKVSNMNRASAIRNARTACTGAQNGGKQDRYADLASKGCDVFKMWIATPDERTRDEHMEAWQEYGDKESAIPYDEPFDVGGEELMFPADPNGSPWNVYNCRCTMRSTFVFKSILSDEMRERANIRLYDEEAQNEANTEPQTASEKLFEFVPAQSIEEAEQQISEFVDPDGWGALGVSYKGISLEMANGINETLLSFFNEFDVPKLNGVCAPAKNSMYGKKIQGATAGYSPVTNNLILNKDSLKNAKTFKAHINEELEAVNNYLAHPDHYNLDRMSSRVANVLRSSEESGRGNTAENISDVINHELGHFLEPQIKDQRDIIESRMSEYNHKISGYACDSYGEYIAESFSSYRRGEDLIDPVLREAFEGLKR